MCLSVDFLFQNKLQFSRERNANQTFDEECFDNHFLKIKGKLSNRHPQKSPYIAVEALIIMESTYKL